MLPLRTELPSHPPDRGPPIMMSLALRVTRMLPRSTVEPQMKTWSVARSTFTFFRTRLVNRKTCATWLARTLPPTVEP